VLTPQLGVDRLRQCTDIDRNGLKGSLPDPGQPHQPVNLLPHQARGLADAVQVPLHQQALSWGVSKKVELNQRADNSVLLYWATKK
jgi:hypothetical protein